ncbi:DNA-directed primase/polymerase protein [Holothuria leucospilota]|uniref:DNA-directed primase/polymerase protein n=1 Tax=Holothuria leucospilota TaxID=206669 RepID=A0A9Q1BFA6_HOLLE|nr:DNA-directed primase/polymerase protein [Holothuria leucospilota]
MERPQKGKALDKEQKWLKKLEMLEETAKFYSRHKLVPEYKPRLTEPMPYWKEFYRQRQALDTATLDKEDVHVFAYEPDEYSSTPNTGKRRYVVTSYAQLWHNIQYLYKHNQPATFYEIIPEGAACKLYFDLEFQKEFNPELDGVAMVTDFVKLVCSKLDQVYNISCTQKNVIILDASTDKKFSNHLIFNLPGAVFKDNIHVGEYITYLAVKLSLKIHLKLIHNCILEPKCTAR